MDNTQQFSPDLGSIEQCALLIEKIHSCADCSIRRTATKKPKSLFGRIHRWHRTWWPCWKLYQAELRSTAARAEAFAHK